MSLKVNDFQCKSCGHEEEQFLFHYEDPNPCPKCGAGVNLVIRKAPFTDVYGSEQWDAKNEISFTSETERRSKMKNLGPGFEPSPSADKHHGARNESHLRLGKKFSFPGQARRS